MVCSIWRGMSSTDYTPNYVEASPGLPPHMLHKINILQAGKRPHEEPQCLIDTLNRGGLWKVNENAQEIFKYTECIFREHTSKGEMKIQDKLLTHSVMCNATVLSHYKNIYTKVEAKVPKEIANNHWSIYSREMPFVCT